MPSTQTTASFNLTDLTCAQACAILNHLPAAVSDKLEADILNRFGCEEGDYLAHRDSLDEDGSVADSVTGQACIEVLNAWVDRDRGLIMYDGGNRSEDFTDMVFTADMVVMRPDRDVPGVYHTA